MSKKHIDNGYTSDYNGPDLKLLNQVVGKDLDDFVRQLVR